MAGRVPTQCCHEFDLHFPLLTWPQIDLLICARGHDLAFDPTLPERLHDLTGSPDLAMALNKHIGNIFRPTKLLSLQTRILLTIAYRPHGPEHLPFRHPG